MRIWEIWLPVPVPLRAASMVDCREWRKSPEPTREESLSVLISAGVGQVSSVHDDHRWMTSGWKYILKSWMCNANLQVKCWKQKLQWQRLHVECENLSVHSAELKCVMRKLEYCLWKGECIRQNLNVAGGKFNDQSANSNVKQLMQNTMWKLECKMRHWILAGLERHKDEF